jgi:hypothetical protein
MIQSVYLIVEPGADRVFVSSRPPNDYVRKPGSKVFLANVDLPGVEIVDGVVAVLAEEIKSGSRAEHLVE